MSTDDCKNFIESVCESHSFKKKDKWKRVRKYKEGELSLRDFQNPDGDILVIAEDKNGHLSVHDVKKNVQLHSDIKASLTKEKLLLELFKLGVDINRNNPNFVKDLSNGNTNFNNAKNGVSENSLLSYFNNNDDSLIKKEVVSHSLTSGSEFDCIHEIIATVDVSSYGGRGYSKPNFVNDIDSNTIGVLYDKENVYGYFKEKEEIAYFKIECGGDWELPVIFFVYWSEKEKRLKGFFPTGSGNVYNEEAKSAYGSEMDALGMSYRDPRRDKLEEKYEQMQEKIQDNYDKYYAKAEEAGFKQLKEHIVKENA